MAEYLFQEETLTALADEVRELSGTTGKMSVGDMTSNLGDANAEVGSQADLIAQIKSAVDNLPEAGESGGGNVDFEHITVYNTIGSDIVINGTSCLAGESTVVPYSLYAPLMFFHYEELPIKCEYTEIYEGDDGEMIEDTFSAAVFWSENAFGFCGVSPETPPSGAVVTIVEEV